MFIHLYSILSIIDQNYDFFITKSQNVIGSGLAFCARVCGKMCRSDNMFSGACTRNRKYKEIVL